MIAARAALAAGVGILVLGACATRAPADAPAEPVPAVEAEAAVQPALDLPSIFRRQPGEVERLVTYFERARKLSNAELTREQEAVRQEYTRSRRDFDRVRLAVTYALPGTPANDETRALELLEPVAKNPRSELAGFAYMLVVFTHEQKRRDASIHGLQQNVQGLQQNVQALQQKLDALKSLEKSLAEREQPGSRKR
jgi:hypothetical protein